MSMSNIRVLDSGDSLVKLAGEIYGDASKFRELAEINNLDIIQFQNSNFNLNDIADTGAQILAPTVATVEQLATEAQKAVIEGARRIEDEAVATFKTLENSIKGIDTTALDLSQIRGANGELPQQLISWLLS